MDGIVGSREPGTIWTDQHEELPQLISRGLPTNALAKAYSELRQQRLTEHVYSSCFYQCLISLTKITKNRSPTFLLIYNGLISICLMSSVNFFVSRNIYALWSLAVSMVVIILLIQGRRSSFNIWHCFGSAMAERAPSNKKDEIRWLSTARALRSSTFGREIKLN